MTIKKSRVTDATTTTTATVAAMTSSNITSSLSLAAVTVQESDKQNALTICDYISSLRSEINPSNHYRNDTIILLCDLSIFFGNAKSFKEITRDDLLSFLDGYRKPEDIDPLHKWIGTYNLYRIQLMRFFKWLYYPNVEQKKRPKPSVIENIPQLKRKEKSI
jgi:hypothetical protein